MTTRLQHQLTYDAPLAAVAAMLRDPEFREEVGTAQHVLRQSVSVEELGATTVVTTERVQAARGIPSFARKLVGDEIEIVQAETWHDRERADYRATIPGKPGEITGTAVLTESGGATTETISLEVSVGVPLVGGRIEGLVADLLVKAFDVEGRVGAAYLARG